jgi:hypothetical protein
MSEQHVDKLPSLKEIDAMAVPLSNDQECTVLCHDLLDAIEQLPGATGVKAIRLHVRIKAIRARMRELHCALCLPD